ncbi:conserved hypothetical protein [Candidatus Brocadia pituitae]|nr:conserved hypothetical protein [Candidatus Brocadia pituitae]
MFNHALFNGALAAVIFHNAYEQQGNGGQQTDRTDELNFNTLEDIFVIIHITYFKRNK